MKGRLGRLAALAFGLAALVSVPAAAQGAAPKTYSVSDARSLLKAIGPDRTVVLKKGDYRLSSAYDVKSDYVSWTEVEGGGKELSLSNLKNLTIRGADGARIVSDSAGAYLLCVSSSANVALDNLRIVRTLPAGTEVAAGSLYAEAVEGLVVDRCSFEGPTGRAIELWECPDARVRRAAIGGASQGAVSAMYSDGLEISGSTVSECEGYPLVYLEGSDEVLISGTSFERCLGGNFIEIYAEAGYVEAVVFSDCVFSGNQVDYFSGTDILPTTEGCVFEDNSFGEDWAENSVAYYADESYYHDEYGDYGYEEPAYYSHYASRLGFYYPQYWELQEADDQGRVGLFSPDGESLVLFVTAYQIPSAVDPAKQGKRVFADSAAALIKLLEEEMGVDLTIGPDGDPSDESGLLSAEYSGEAIKGEGEKAVARVRFLVSEGSVHAFVAFASSGEYLEPESETDQIISSVGYLSEGD